jgi:hypothetical protein
MASNADSLIRINDPDLGRAPARQLPTTDFDMVIRRAVVAEVFESRGISVATHTLLVPGGLMLHHIDLSDYGMFSNAGMHPLTVLTIPDVLHRLLAGDCGIPD